MSRGGDGEALTVSGVGYPRMESRQERHIGDILKERNIILIGADAATRGGFTQVPNFLLKSNKLSAGDTKTFAMLLSYAWQPAAAGRPDRRQQRGDDANFLTKRGSLLSANLHF